MRKRYKLLLTVFILFLTRATYAQDYCCNCNFDSLKNQLELKKNPAEKVKLLGIMLESYITKRDHSKELELVNQLIEFNRQAKTIDEAPYIKMRDGYLNFQKSEWDQALIKLKESVELFDKQHKVIANLLSGIRVLYNKLNQQEDRLQYYTQKLAYYRANGPIENTAPCYHAIGGYYALKNDYNSAINNYLKAADIYKNFDFHDYVNDIGVVGNVYADWGNDRKAIEYFNVALPLLDTSDQSYIYSALTQLSIKNAQFDEAGKYAIQSLRWGILPNEHAIALLGMAFVHLYKNEPGLAEPYLDKAKKMEDSAHLAFNSNYGVLQTDFAYYKYYMLKNNPQLAEQSLLAAIRKAVTSKNNKFNLKYLKELHDFYTSQNRLDLAGKYIEDYFRLANSIQKQENNFKVAQYENERKESEQNKRLNALQQERAVQDATIKQRNLILWVSLGAILLIAGSVIFLYRQLTINKKVLMSLRKTQRQLILSEKMASLGELTAGIAHEIQNPLNFVNNFSEVNTELIEELKQELVTGNTQEAISIADGIKENEQKINYHGKRADSIVKGMLQHSRASSGKKEPTDINALVDEYLRLSYHGLRAKDKSFNATMQTDFDEKTGMINIIPQDIGRVLLNLFTNAFYSVDEKKKSPHPLQRSPSDLKGSNESYEPTVSVTTKRLGSLSGDGGKIEIKVKDNGMGIPQKVLDKIYQPFFTTKPTGQGTGLGLSMSYDIIKAHGGEIKVETNEGEGATFIILLPA